jgi:hypothetical protein
MKNKLWLIALIVLIGFVFLPLTGCHTPEDGAIPGVVNQIPDDDIMIEDDEQTPGDGDGGSEPIIINIKDIEGVTVPIPNGTPVTSITENDQYTGTVTWSPSRTVKIDMFDSGSDGWDGNGALRINVNGVDIAGNVKVINGSSSTYSFNVDTDDEVNVYWIKGSYQEENSFIMYYADTPPSPSFTSSNNGSWNGDNALVCKLRGTMRNIEGDTLLGSFIASGGGTFVEGTQYTATITLTAKTGYTLQGVEADFFSVEGAATVSNSADSGVITAVFPVTGESTPVITLSQTDPHIFSAAAVGYAAQTPLSVTVTNIGSQPTGALTIKLTGANLSSFTLSKESITSILLNGEDTFTIAPAVGLTARTYAAIVSISSGNNILATFNVSFTVNALPTAATPTANLAEGEVTNGAAVELGTTTAGAEIWYTTNGNTPAKNGAGSAKYTAPLTITSTVTVKAIAVKDGMNNSAIFTATYIITQKISILAIQGVTAPVVGATPVTGITGNDQYMGTVSWSPAITGGSKTVKIDMFDSDGDGWNGNGALRINVNGVDIATVKVQTTAANNNPSGQRNTNTYNFNVNANDAVKVYWVAGTYQEENSFIMYYTDKPPSPSFTSSNNNSWNGSNALIYKLRGTMNNISGNTLLGSFTASGSGPFAGGTQYTATISLTAKIGYTLQGVAANSFTVANATTVRNDADSGVITAVFPSTAFSAFASAPTLTLTPSSEKITYTFTASSPAADTYDLYYIEGSGKTAEQIKGGTKISGVTSGGNITGLTNDTTYSVIVTANKTGYAGSNSAVKTATPAPLTYGVTLSQTDAYTFTSATAGYAAQTSLSVTVTNTGNQATGALTIGLTGADPTSFTLSKTSMSNIAVSGKDTFTIAPSNGLAVKTYAAIVTVSGGNGINQSFIVSFTVTPASFTSAPTLTLNPGNEKITYTWTASNPVAGAYDVYWKAGSGLTAEEVKTGTKITGAASGGAITGLINDTVYSVIVTANKTNYNSVDSTVQKTTPFLPTYGVTLSQTEAYTFTSAAADYASQNPLSVTVTNSGNQATGALTIRLTGADQTSFSLSKTSITNIAAGGTDTFTIAPVNGLAVKTYAAIVTVSGGNGINRTFNVDFTVTSASFTSTPTLTLNPGNEKITYTWTASNPAADTYDVYWAEGSGLTAAQVKSGIKITGATNGGKITGLTDDTIYSVIVTANKSNYTSVDSNVLTAIPVGYIITGSGTAFTATKAGETIGTGNQPIQNVINAIRTHANGDDCSIQFGNGIDVLNIGTASASFNNGVPWGLVELRGKITGNGTSSTTGTITIGNTVSLTSVAEIANTADNTNARAVYNTSTGAVTISGGIVSATTGSAVYNASTGAINISGGMVSATTGVAVYNASSGKITVSQTAGATTNVTSANTNSSRGTIYIADSGTATAVRLEITGGTVENTVDNTVDNTNARAIYNASTGAVNIWGGTVSVTKGVAIYNASIGKVTVSQPAGVTTNVTSTNNTSSTSTIYIADSGTNIAVRLEITGGTIENTSYDSNANTICNASTGAVTISGGMLSATGGRAIYNASTGAVTISGGTVSATTGRAIYNNSTGTVTISGGTVTATSWGSAIYNASTGAVTISGGTVSSNGVAIYNVSTGKINVSQAVGATTKVTSANTSSSSGTIYIANSGTATAVRLEITGGTVENTSTTTGNAIRNDSTGSVNITGGTVSKAGNGNYALYRDTGSGSITIGSGATITGNKNW